jgi:outer membrane protein OmpA-like peptidoglycan-associated protein
MRFGGTCSAGKLAASLMRITDLLRGVFFYRILSPLLFLPLLLVSVPVRTAAEEIELSAFYPEFRYAQTERENMRVYINERYRGLQYRQRRIFLEREESARPGNELFRGSVYTVKNLSRDGNSVFQPVDTQLSVQCLFTPLGLRAPDNSALPFRSGFPVFPDEDNVAIGDTWQADGEDSIRIDDAEELISIPFHCTYTYCGLETVMERQAQTVDFEYGYFDRNPYRNDSYELRGRGEGSIFLFLDKAGGYFINERLIRHFLDSSGKVVRREEGFRLTWGRGISRAEVDSLSRKLALVLLDQGGEGGDKVSSGGGEEKIEIKETVEGIKISLPEIHFYPDEARILPSEKDRLDRLAELLKSVPESDFLIKGHTADVGTKESQYVLSVDRARTILEEMEKRGLKSDRFIYQGLGGDEPVATNDTEEGRARNRRVEVIILNQ